MSFYSLQRKDPTKRLSKRFANELKNWVKSLCQLWGKLACPYPFDQITTGEKNKVDSNALTSSILSTFMTSYFFTSHLSPTCNARDLGSIPGLERFPGEGNSYLLQYSGLENSRLYGPRDRKELDTTERLSHSPISHRSLIPSPIPTLFYSDSPDFVYGWQIRVDRRFEKWNIVIFSKMQQTICYYRYSENFKNINIFQWYY